MGGCCMLRRARDGEFCVQLSHEIDEQTKQRAEKLKHDVKKMLRDLPIQELDLINEIQRLGVAYHFETEIRNALNRIYNAENNDNDGEDIYAVALRFRLLRQEGYNVSSGKSARVFISLFRFPLFSSLNKLILGIFDKTDVFKKFKDEKGDFKAVLRDNIPGLLSLYEAAYFSTRDDSILDEALDFATNQLNSVLPHLSSPLSELVKLALDLPLLKRIERLQSRYFISIYQKDKGRNDVLLEFAKLDFNILQSLHKKELSELSRYSYSN
ncbi:threalose-6-phosphate phosphatase [Asimina triloba]